MKADSVYATKPWLAHYKIPAELPIPGDSLIDAFEKSVKRNPSAPAIYYFDRIICFGRLNEQAKRFAAMLSHEGIGSGDRVAVAFQNDPQFAIAQLGAWKRGAIVVPLNPMYTQREVDIYLADSGARLWVGLDTLERGTRSAVHRFAVSIDDPEMTHALELFEPDEPVRVDVSPEHAAYLVYTSGTTGEPKGVVCLHRNVMFSAEVYRAWAEIGPQDVILGMAPLFHVTGLVAQLALSLLTGAPLILFHRFDTTRAFEYSAKWNATFSLASTTAYIALMNAPSLAGRFPAKALCGGAPVPAAVANEISERFGVALHNVYGLTESNSPSLAVPLGTRAPTDPSSGALSIGVPVPGCEAKIVDLADASRALPVGESGELAIKGPMIFPRYWNKPEATAAAFHDGFFLTGDVAIMDEQGWFYIIDRKKDMINASGFKVWPREVEEVLYEHPAVREAAVVGVPDSYRGETVKAVIALRHEFEGIANAEQMIAFCKERLATYKCPRVVEFVTEIPKTATGKVLRRVLKGPNQNT